MVRVFFACVLSLVTAFAFASEKVEYISDAISQKNGSYLKLRGGSSWVLSRLSLALPTNNVVLVFRVVTGKGGSKQVLPVFYCNGEEIIAKHVGGAFVKETGLLVTVVKKAGDGSKLKLDDGSTLSIPQYDRYDTGWWLPPYQAILTGNRMYMLNLEKGKRVWVDGVQ